MNCHQRGRTRLNHVLWAPSWPKRCSSMRAAQLRLSSRSGRWLAVFKLAQSTAAAVLGECPLDTWKGRSTVSKETGASSPLPAH